MRKNDGDRFIIFIIINARFYFDRNSENSKRMSTAKNPHTLSP